MKTLKTVLAAVLVFGTASVALADDGTDFRLDTSRTGYAFGQQVAAPQFTGRNVALQGVQSQVKSYTPDIAGASHDNGGN
jgi:hypothetical protein